MSGPKDDYARIERERLRRLEAERRREEERRKRVRLAKNKISDAIREVEKLCSSLDKQIREINKTSNKYGFKVPSEIANLNLVASANQVLKKISYDTENENVLSDTLQHVRNIYKDFESNNAQINRSKKLVNTKTSVLDQKVSLNNTAKSLDKSVEDLKTYSKETDVKIPSSFDTTSYQTRVDKLYQTFDLNSDNQSTIDNYLNVVKTKQYELNKEPEVIADVKQEMKVTYNSKLMDNIANLSSEIVRLEKERKAKEELEKEKARIRQEQELIEKEHKNLEIRNNLLNSILDDLNQVENLMITDSQKSSIEEIKKNASNITDLEYLKNYRSITVGSFVKECKKVDKEYNSIYSSYSDLLATYQVLCEQLNLIPKNFPITHDSLTMLDSEIQTLRQEVSKREQEIYIQNAFNEVMEEMGYNVIGCSKEKLTGVVENYLFQYDDESVANVTITEDNNICMELGYIDEKDREPSKQEAIAQEVKMKQFCTTHKKIKEKLKEKGVILEGFTELPPDEEYAQVFNINDYEIVDEVAKDQIMDRLYTQQQNQQVAVQKKTIGN